MINNVNSCKLSNIITKNEHFKTYLVHPFSNNIQI